MTRSGYRNLARRSDSRLRLCSIWIRQPWAQHLTIWQPCLSHTTKQQLTSAGRMATSPNKRNGVHIANARLLDRKADQIDKNLLLSLGSSAEVMSNHILCGSSHQAQLNRSLERFFLIWNHLRKTRSLVSLRPIHLPLQHQRPGNRPTGVPTIGHKDRCVPTTHHGFLLRQFVLDP